MSVLQAKIKTLSKVKGAFSRKKNSVEQDQGANVCLMRDSPFRIFKVIDSGEVVEVERLIQQKKELLKLRNVQGNSIIHKAVIGNKPAVLELLINFGVDLDCQNKDGNTALHIAVENEFLDIIDMLVIAGANTGVLNNLGFAPLHLATELNKYNVLEHFKNVKHRFDFMQPGVHGQTAMHIAAIHDFDACLRVLLFVLEACPRRPCDNGFYPIHEAARHASSKTIQVMIEWCEANGRSRSDLMNVFDAEGNVPLHSAIHSGCAEAVELCLLSGARISIQQFDLSTPVHLAAAQGSLDLIQLMFLLQPTEKFISLETADAQHMTPLHCAAMFDQGHVVQYMVGEGANLESRDKEERTPLLLAASRSAWKTVGILISAGSRLDVVDGSQRNVLHLIVINGGLLTELSKNQAELSKLLNQRDCFGCSSLHYASSKGLLQNLRDLVCYGASMTLRNHRKENPFYLAARNGRTNVIRQLLSYEKSSVYINESDENGMTPLHAASTEGHVGVVQLLLSHGALLHRDHQGRTPLHLAVISGHKETSEMLLTVHSHLLDQQDKFGNTALHLASIENHPGVISMLLSHNCQIIPNKSGMYSVDCAIQRKHDEATLALVTHENRSDEIIRHTPERDPCVFVHLIRELPRVCQAVLDGCIVRSKCREDSKSHNITYSFRHLQMSQERLDEMRLLKGDPSYEPPPLCSLNGMVSHGRVELLLHPLCQKYLEFKWNSYGACAYAIRLIWGLLFLTCVTLFSSVVLLGSDERKLNGTSSEPTGRYLRKYPTMAVVCASFIVVFISVEFMLDLVNIIQQKWRYFCISTYTSWLMRLSACFMIMPIFTHVITGRTYSFAAVAVFLCWVNLLISFQRLYYVGIYVVMFLEILKTLLRVLSIFSVLIIAFGSAFYILLSEVNPIGFGYLPLSILRTFSMMLGELDYITTFATPLFNFMSGKETDKFTYPVTTMVMLVIFIILVPILLMNLLIGLAVGDIESVKSNAQLKRLAKQVEIHTDLERLLPRFILKRGEKTEMVEYPNQSCIEKGPLSWLMGKLVGCCENKDINFVRDSRVNEIDEWTNQKRKLSDIARAVDAQGKMLHLIAKKMDVGGEFDELIA